MLGSMENAGNSHKITLMELFPYTPGGSDCKESRFDPWVGKIPWRKEWLSTPVFLPGKSHGRGAWQVLCITRVRHNLVAKPPLTDLGWCFPGGASRKELLANAGDMEDKGLIPWLGRSLGEGHSNPLQYSWLENP